MDADEGSSLLTKLQSADLHHIHRLFSDYLHPFTDLTANPKKSKKPSDHATSVRSLAKRFLPFLNRSLSLIHKRLSETPKIDQKSALQLFSAYKLCLDCLDCVSSQLEGKPYAVCIQRVRLMHCFEAWGRHGEAQSEGLFVLERLRGIEIGGGNGPKKAVKKKCRYTPVLGKERAVDHDFAVLVVEIVVTLVNCVYTSQSKEEMEYRRVIDLVDEAAPWFRVLDANTYEKMHRVLVTYLNRCTLFLVGEVMDYNNDLMREFCLATFAEYSKSVMKDQLQKLTRRICSSLFSVQGNQLSSIFGVLTCVLDFMAGECKVENENTIMDFIELVEYCSSKCRTAARSLCSPLAIYLTKQAGECIQVLPPIDTLLRLFAAGLFVSDCNGQSRQDSSTTIGSKKDGSGIAFLLDKEDLLHDLSALIGKVKRYFPTTSKAISVSISAELLNTEGSMHQTDPHIKPNYDTSGVCKLENGKWHLLSYCKALTFLCQPLADFLNSAKKEILAETEGASYLTKLSIIQDALHQFIDVFSLCRRTCDWKCNDFDDYKNAVVSVAVAALILSFRTKLYLKESISFVKQVISADWIQANDLKYIFAALYNVGITLYRNKQVREASVAVKLCCRASWTCVSCLCESFTNKSNSFCTGRSEDAVTVSVSEACAKSAFLLDLLYQCNSHNKLSKTMSCCLENWSAAENVFERLPSPVVLVKQWVKIECKFCKEPNAERMATTLYSLVSSSERVSVRSLGIILEQELLAYQDMSPLYPMLCQKMQMDIVDVLVEKVYVTDDNCLQKCKLLIAKGQILRASGIEGLNGCIKCLSDVISMMNDMDGGEVQQSVTSCHQLAVAYSLRALCIHEAEPNCKQPFEDIQAAVNLWLRFDCCFVDNQHDMALENMPILLYHVIDILSIKGFTKFHDHLYELLIRSFKMKNVAMEKCLALLWQYRRLGHALCASPVSEGFITTFSQHCGEFSKSINFWKSSMSGSLPLEVGFQLSFSFILTNFSHGSCNTEHPFQPDIKVDEIKKVALDLTSKVPLCTSSIFLAASLYYDLCGRMVSTGRIIEALSYAKEAHHLRSKLLKENFRYSMEQQSEIYDENGAIMQKPSYRLCSFHMYSTVATAVWDLHNISSDVEGCLLTPWNVLQSYLESILQVGIIHELIGDGSEAETLLQWGKSISSFQDLPLFKVAFSSVLGILYRKQQLWDLAEKELHSAKQILADCCGTISCTKCRLLFEVTIDLHLGDLVRSRHDKYATEKGSVYAETLYKSALDKLNLSDWKNSVSSPEDVGLENITVSDAMGKNHSDVNEFPSKVDELEVRIEAKKTRKTKKALKQLQGEFLVAEQSSRMTRSRYHSQKTDVNIPCDIQVGRAKYSKSGHSSAADSGCKVTCVCNKLKCWYCLPIEVLESGCINDFVHMKWEFARRRLLLKLLTGKGKCLGLRGETHEARELFLQSISVLVSRNLFCTNPSVPSYVLLDMVGKEIPGDPLAIERATVLYNLCWFTLKNYPCKDTRLNSCTDTSIQIPRIISWMMLAFVLCREIPVLVQKVSRLLAAIFVLSSSTQIFPSYVSPCKALSESHWASYFHQASLGTHLNLKVLSTVTGKRKVQDPINVEGFCLPGSTSIASETLNLLRLAPESFQDLEDYVLRFFRSLPCTSIVGLSLLGGAFARLLSELLGYPSPAPAWILLSRLHSNCQPVVLFLPLDSILEGATDDYMRSGSGILFEDKSFAKRWHCPWGSNVIDDLAPEFKRILEENFSSSSMHHLEDTKDNRSLWWGQRNNLDQRLSKFLRNLEDLWFGPWKFLLLGGFSGCNQQEPVLRKFVHNLKVKCNVDAQEGLLKVILGGAKHACESEECILQLILGKGCFIGYSNQERHSALSDACQEFRSLSKRVFKLALEASHEVDEGDYLNREPVILVLDFDVQMLPWENLPVVRNQEVYRMPSIGSIFATLDRCCQFHEHDLKNAGIFPFIDPLDGFYLLNPSGDLNGTQDAFEDYFRDRNLEGMAGSAPTIEELALALRSHDLFIYFGHGSGMQFIPEQEIQKLHNCAATLLMGCSSGSVSLKGSYTPHGAPLCYLLAGSPVIVANLWEVTDKDIDRFAKAMLDCCLEERLTDSIGCVQCNLVSEKFNSMQITGTKGNAKKKTSRKNVVENFDSSIHNDRCNHRPKVGSFMGQAREACKLPFLIGASPVCYGVPTGIHRKRDL